MGRVSAEQALRALEPLVGEWTVEAKGPDGRAWPGAGRASFQWHPARAHLVQRTVINMPGAPDSIATEWILQREGEPFPQRFIGTFSDEGRTIAGRWEKAENGPEFTVDFYLTYRKQ
jgi:hypothetical protein